MKTDFDKDYYMALRFIDMIYNPANKKYTKKPVNDFISEINEYKYTVCKTNNCKIKI